MNYQYLLTEWRRKFREDDFFSACGERRVSLHPIVGPHDICAIEWVRNQLQNEVNFGEGVPVDYFVWAQGEGDLVGSSRFGGRPDLPSLEQWPKGRGGTHLPFLAQINFSDSKDLVAVPADLLSIFALIENGCVEEHALLWSDPNSVGRVAECDMPETRFQIEAHHGYVCRFPVFPKFEFKRIWHSDDKYKLPDGEASIEGEYCMPPGSCIGGKDFELNNFVLRLCNLVPTPYVSFPYINRSAAYDNLDEWEFEFVTQALFSHQDRDVEWPSRHFSFSDLGSLILRTEENGGFVLETTSF